MLSTLIQLCLLLAVLCVASESYHRPASESYHRPASDAYHRPSTDARIRKFSSDLAAVRVSPPSERWRRGERPPMRHHPVSPAGGSSSSSSASGDIRLVDIVLAASIDGHFHALNRTTGELLWSMTDDLSHSQSPRDPHTDSAPPLAAQSPLYNLVRSDHRALVDPDLAVQDEDEMETYVVEPQTGDIFVMASDGDMIVERLGYSVPQLVELSPFKPPGDDERMFVGRKTTSLISLDLLTGRILGVYGEQCTWDDNTVEAPDAPVDVDALLDDLDGTREMPKKQRPVEVVIGRTDYHVSVHVKGKGVVQTLAFTKYGPNNVHRAIQAAWTRSPDSIYFQPSPDNNRLFCFANGGLLRFERTYPLVVAVFDAVFLPTKRNPILLLQPTPQLSELSSAYRSAPGDMPQVTFVGRIDDSLFALSHINYPLVMFPSTPKKSVPRIDDGGKTPPGPDQTPNDERCYDLDCYVGTKRSRFASRSSLSRLLGEAHTLGMIEGTVGVESEEQVAEVYPEHEIPQSHSQSHSHTWTREHTKTPGGVRPTPTTRNSSLPVVRSEEEKEEAEEVPRATPSHRTVLGRVAREWVAAWAGMGTVLVSTVVFGFGLVGKGRSKSGIWRVKEVGDGDEKVDEKVDEKARIIMANEPDEEDEEDDTPPPVPPKPASFSFSKMTGSPYAITVDSRPADSRPALPPKDPIEAKLKKVRPRNRAGLPSSASVPVLPDLKPVGMGNGTKSAIELAQTPVELARTALAAPAELARTPVELARTKTVDLTATEGETEIEPEVGAEPETPGKRRVRRGRRGKGRGKGSKGDVGSGGDEAPPTIIAGTLSEGSETFVKVEKAVPVVTPLSSLVVTEDVLGYGSHGTVVYKGRFQGRMVAVKRLLHDFVTLASREVALLQESDDHPNVIRYYYEERRDNFLYIALELCPCSLADLVERPNVFPEVSGSFDPKRALGQVTAGLKHLHALKIVHRDIKPQNILVSVRGAMLISDFGLCRKLDVDQTSFLPTAYGSIAAGTAGWRAPEILRGEVKLDTPELDVSSGGVGSSSSNVTAGTRLTRSVDVFALGCLFYYVLTNGEHPFGSRYERDVNIMADNKKLGGLERFGEEGMEAIDLIGKMLSPEPKARPDTTACLMHPFFWNPSRRLAFLQDASDRFEIMERDPREAGLVALETNAVAIVGTDWQRKLDKMFIDNLGKFRKYDVRSVQDLLRALRNKKNHYQDLPDSVKRHLGPLPEGFLSYFTKRYPRLFLHVYGVVESSALKHESMFRSYFMLEE